MHLLQVRCISNFVKFDFIYVYLHVWPSLDVNQNQPPRRPAHLGPSHAVFRIRE